MYHSHSHQIYGVLSTMLSHALAVFKSIRHIQIYEMYVPHVLHVCFPFTLTMLVLVFFQSDT